MIDDVLICIVLMYRFQLQSRKSVKYNSMLQATRLIVNKEGLW